MNHVYRVIWNIASAAWQAVSEVSKGSGKVKSERRRQRTASATSAAGALLFISTQLCAAGLPQGGVVSSGNGNIAQPNANTLNVTQNSNKMAVDWQSFSVGQGKTVNFIQPGSSAVILNRVIGNDISSIQGAIKANGQVFLINPNGVIFSPTAQINVGSLIASTRNITNQQFNTGNYRFEGSSNSAIINQGNITTADGGRIILIAARIENTGSINAPKGFVGFASGNLVTLDMGGPVKLKVEQGTIDSLINNGGIIKAEGGQILLTAKAAGDLAASVVNNSGIINASSIDATGGKIVLLGDHISNSGKLAANGATGGGEILVGGDWQGSNADLYPHASRVTLTETSDISAQATQQGNGGKIVLWSGMDKSNGQTSVAGRLNAEGRGSQSAGGKIETSGKSLVIAEGTDVKTKGGEWLLDPVNITIDSTLAGTISSSLNSGSVTISTTSPSTNNPSTGGFESGTDGDITVNSAISKNSGPDSTLTLKAHRHIKVASGASITSEFNKLNIVLWANQDGAADGRIEIGNSGTTLTNITTNGGGIWMGGGSGSTTWTPSSGASAITVGNGYALSTSGSTLSSSNQSNGISLLATRINTAGGNVALYGDSETSLQVNDGIRMQYDATPTSATQINAGAGKIYVDGKTASGGTYNFGLDIKGTTLTSTSTAADAITLKGSSNTTGNDQAVVAGNTTITASQGGVILNLTTQNASDSAWDPGAPGADSTIIAKDLTITSNGKLRLGAASDSKTTMLVSGITTVNAQNGINIEMGSSANQLGTLLISGSLGQASITNSNTLTVNGITGASGPLSVETLTGNLTLAGNVATSSTATNAIVLNAGKNTAAGTSAGGDIIVSGSPTVSTGAGGRATLYTGSVAGSTGLSNLIGSGSGRFRYNSDESASNFSTALAAGKYAIYRERPTVAVNVQNQAKTYDGVAYTGSNSATTTGFVNGDTSASLSGSLSYTINSGNVAKNAGTYAIAASGYSNGLGYNLAYNNGALTINKAVLTVTADNKTRTYGEANPALSSTLSGFKNGETASTAGVTGAASLSTTATQTTNAGTAAITAAAGTLAANNYTFTNTQNGTLTINKAALTVTADDKTKTVGEANPTLTTTVSGFKNGETATTAGVTGSGSASTTANQTTSAGSAVIAAGAGTLAASNYSFTNLVNGTLTITPATSSTNNQTVNTINNAISSVTTGSLGMTFSAPWPGDAISFSGNGSFGLDPKLSLAELKKLGTSAELLKANGYSAKALSDAGYDLKQLKEAGYTLAELKELKIAIEVKTWWGYVLERDEVLPLKNAGYSAKELKDAGFSHFDLQKFDKAELAAAFSVTEIKKLYGDYTLGVAFNFGYSKKEIADAGYSFSDLKSKGVTANNLFTAGFTVEESLKAGYSLKEISAAFPKDQIMDYLAVHVIEDTMKYKKSDIEALGYSLNDILHSRSSTRSNGLSNSSLKACRSTQLI